MYKILKKRGLNPTVTLMEIEALLVAKKADPGQFIMLRTDKNGERVPLTIADFDREKYGHDNIPPPSRRNRRLQRCPRRRLRHHGHWHLAESAYKVHNGRA
jgi:hypothetical protein